MKKEMVLNPVMERVGSKRVIKKIGKEIVWGKPRWVKVTPSYARAKMKVIIPREGASANSRRRRLGTYCENCGILFHGEYLNEQPVMFKTFFVCAECKEKLEAELKDGVSRSVPNLIDAYFTKESK